MDFPRRIVQHKNESDSFAIILYKLKSLGIFRNMTEHDYGIDFEIEVVNGDRVEGHCVKVQVKSSDNPNVRVDGYMSVGGIKQSTLYYWAELSYNIPVVGIAVDVKTEDIYVSAPLFWQCVTKIDASDSTKSIEFCPTQQPDIQVKNLAYIANTYNLRDFLNAHKWIIRNLKAVFEMYDDASHYDSFLPFEDPQKVISFLEYAKTFLSFDVNDRNLFPCDMDIFSWDYYVRPDNYDEPTNRDISIGLADIIPCLCGRLKHYKDLFDKSAYYWIHKNPEYLRLVMSTEIPDISCKEQLENFCYETWKREHSDEDYHFGDFLEKVAERAGCSFGSLVTYYRSIIL